MANLTDFTDPIIQYQLEHINDSRIPSIRIAAAFCLSAAYIAVFLRVLSRQLGNIKLGSDDWCIILALPFTTAFVTTILGMIHLGLGRHAVLLTDPEAFRKEMLAVEELYNPSIIFIKISILLLYRRLFTAKDTNIRFNRCLWSLGLFVIAYSTVQALACIFQCTPIEALWDPSITKKKCINYNDVLIFCSSMNVMTDVLILILPLPHLWRQHKSRKEWCMLTPLFFGASTCTIAIVRATQVRNDSSNDPSWSDAIGAVWSIVELNFGIVSVCLPTYQPLFARLRHCECHLYGRFAQLRKFTWSKDEEAARASSDVETLVDAKGVEKVFSKPVNAQLQVQNVEEKEG